MARKKHARAAPPVGKGEARPCLIRYRLLAMQFLALARS